MKTVKRKEFIDWVLEDTEDWLANKDWIINSLKVNNKVTVEELFEKTGFIPAKLIVEEEVDDTEEFYPNIDCKLEPLKK